MPLMVVPLANPATQPRASWRATRRDGAHVVQGCVARNLFGTTKPRSSRLALRHVGTRRGRHQTSTDPSIAWLIPQPLRLGWEVQLSSGTHAYVAGIRHALSVGVGPGNVGVYSSGAVPVLVRNYFGLAPWWGDGD